MKICFFCASLQAGGAERVLSILSYPLCDHYEEVEYIMWYDAPVFYPIDKRIKLVSVEKECKSKNFLKKMIWLRKYIITTHPEIILSFSAPFNMILLTCSIFTHQKVIACERTDPHSFRWGRHLEILRNLLYGTANGILVQTQISKSYFTGSLLKKTNIIYNPVSMCPDEIGSALSVEKEKLIVTAGRLAAEKCHNSLIRGFYEFKKNHPDYRLIIYGEGSERNNLEFLIKNLDLNQSVFLPGKCSDIWNKIKKAEVFIMTSRMEGMSNSMIEAMCLGLPTISTKVSGAIDLMVNEENGILIDSNEATDISKALSKICDNKNLAKKLGENASKLYYSLNVKKISQEWIGYIDNKLH